MKLDMELIEQLAELNRANTPERIFFAKGVGAHGVFQPYMSMGDYTEADFLQDPEKETPVFVRFSNGLGAKGSSDTQRNFRGFATRFFTEEGNYDLLCSSLPVFFIKEPKKIVALMKALKPSPKTNLLEDTGFWKFIGDHPESIHMLLYLYSDRGTIKSYRHMEGYSVNTYLWKTQQGETFFVRYFLEPMLGFQSITRQESEFLAGFDPDTASRDLYESLEQDVEVTYELSVQLLRTKDKYRYDFDLLDTTRRWPEKVIPVTKIGKLTLRQLPENYKNEVERIGFHPANVVPGISLSPDPMLEAMCFICSDAQRHRLMTGGNYENSYRAKAFQDMGIKNDTKDIYYKTDFYSQAGQFYRSLNDMEKNRLIENLLDSMIFVTDEIQEKIVDHLSAADEELGAIVAMGLNF